MFKFTSFSAALLITAAPSSFATPVVTYASGSALQAEVAFSQWQSGLTSYSVDQLDGAAGSSFAVVTNAGSKFSTVDDRMLIHTVAMGVIQGTALELTRTGKSTDIVWTLATPSNAFGFFGFDLDIGVFNVTFFDGTTSSYSYATTGNELSSFWGISGLSKDISSVSFSTTDNGGVTDFDRFVTGVSGASATVNKVPEPSSAALLGLGLVGLLAVKRRRQL